MRSTIAQFMWGFQSHFRNGLERVARNVFEQIGFGLGARAFLVGFTDNPEHAFPVCFEPEHDPLAAVDLSSVVADALQRYQESDESRMVYSSRRHQERIHLGLMDSFRAAAVRDALAHSPEGTGMTFFVGSSALVDGIYKVHPVLAVPTTRWQSKPALSKERIDRYAVVPSFQRSLMRELLIAATADLRSSTPPEDFSARWSDRSELIRKAAHAFVQSVSVFSGYEFPSELTVALDEISAQPYEGRSGSGGLLLASAANPHVEPVLEFVTPIRVSETRSMRKALEMADPQHHLLCDGEQVVGLARLRDTYEPAGENAFLFSVMSRGVWELSHNEVPLLRVSNTRPSLPQPRLDAQHFKSVARRVFAEIGEREADVLWGLAESASAASHGTMLVVHRSASDEAARLVPQAQQVRPQLLDSNVLAAVTSIDGAVLVDPTGTCHAVGVILDGHASGKGDASRGARFNSAVRYHDTQRGQCLVIIVSEDGMINLLPNLRRQVTRESVEAVVRQLEESLTDDPDYEVFFRPWEHLESLAFYLSAEQCDRINTARTRLEEHRARPRDRHPNEGPVGHITHVGWTPFVPDPEMDASYFLDAD
ncbi:DNA integrity scanning protein DisA nucleotide-binding domain protein [Kribbella sp. NPDC059898]|uniref:DNA integrity scanning protein DisA nucleotide-binding domain protein n=1 Tax=Kribbella sp. NPDC059898 TaxID=3346995 RepID=UPI0036667F03